jgi:hypothetical protein
MNATDWIGHAWNLPNSVVGAVLGIGGRWRWRPADRVFEVDGGWMAAIFGRLGYAGMCVGDIVLTSQPLSESTWRHELAHARQGRFLGPLYLPLTLACYAIGFLRCPGLAHDASPLEIDADRRSGNSENNQWLRRCRERTGRR